MKNKLLTLLMGVWFGIVLVKSQVVSWQQINDMFYFRSAYMYLVIASAVFVGAVSLLIIRRFDVQTIDKKRVDIRKKPFHKGVVFGGTLFGMGWAITGACPGPIYAQIGAGTLLAVVTFIGALTGMYIYAYLQQKLPHDNFAGFKARTGSAGSSS